MTFPQAVPEIPAADVDVTVDYYVTKLGFTKDWGGEDGGIAGLSRGDCRLFVTNPEFHRTYGNGGRIVFWLNVNSKAKVDALFAEWKAAGAMFASEPEDKPWRLREFTATDPDGNRLRVFYDFKADDSNP